MIWTALFVCVLLPHVNSQGCQFPTVAEVKTNSHNITIDGGLQNVNLTESCTILTFNIPTGYSSALVLDIPSGSSATVVSESTLSTDPQNAYDFDGLESVGIPYCFLKNYYGSWYIRLSKGTSTGDVVQVNLRSVTAETLLQGQPGSKVSGTLEKSIPLLGRFSLGDTSKSQLVQFKVNSTGPKVLFSRLDACPSSYVNDGFPLRTTQSGQVAYFSVQQSGAGQNTFDLTVDVKAAVCLVYDQSLFTENVCRDIVTYPTLNITREQITSKELSVSRALSAGSTSPLTTVCSLAFRRYLCGLAFEKCDENQFPLPICPEDCGTLVQQCGFFQEQLNCATTGGNCYVNPSTDATDDGTSSQVGLLQVNLFFIGVVFSLLASVF